MAQLGVPFPLCRQYSWQKPLALTEKICQIVLKVTTKITCTALWTKNSVHSAHLAALNKVHRKLDVVQVTMLAARWRIWSICCICNSLRQELFSSLQLRLTQILIKTSFWHPNKLCPLQCFLLAFVEFLAFFKPAYLQQNCLNNMTPNCCKNDVVFADVPSRKILRKVSRQRGSPRTKGNFDHYPLPSVQPSERCDFKCKQTPKNCLCIIPFVVGICPMCLVCC